MRTECRSCKYWLSPEFATEGCPNCGLSGHFKDVAQLRNVLDVAVIELHALQRQANRVNGWCPFSWYLGVAITVTAAAIAVGTVRLSNGFIAVDDIGSLAKILSAAELATASIWWMRRIGASRTFEPNFAAKEREVLDLRRELADMELMDLRKTETGARGRTPNWSRPCLLQDTYKIQTRLQKIQIDRRQLQRQREMLLNEDSRKWKAALDLITTADTELGERSDRERIALREISLAQWINNLEAYSLGIEELDAPECDSRLRWLRRVTANGRALLELWDRDDGVHPLTNEPETSLGADALVKSARCRQQVAQGLAVCQELCDGVQARRVVATVNAVGNHAVAPTDEYVPRARTALEELMARSEIGQLRESFRQLEDLAAHSSARREVDRLTAWVGLS